MVSYRQDILSNSHFYLLEVVNDVDADFKKYMEEYLLSENVKWQPGILDGKPVTSAMILPVSFVIGKYR